MSSLNASAADKPFVLYYVPGGTHSPHQLTNEWIEKFKGKFDGLREVAPADHTGDREVNQGPQRADRNHGRGLPAEVGPRRRGGVPRLVIQKNPALPIVEMDAEDIVGKEQYRDAALGLGHGEQMFLRPEWRGRLF